MKLKLFPFLLLLTVFEAHSENTWKLSDAIKQGIISAKISGAKPDSLIRSLSSNYGPCMEMELSNKNAYPVVLTLEYGYLLEPEDSSLQTMMVTRLLNIKLNANQKRSEKIYAMCTEATDRSPYSTANFYMTKRATGSLLGLAGLINQKGYQNGVAQNAVWCLTNNHDLSLIYDEDTAMMYNLRRYIAKAKGIPIPKIYANANDDYAEPERTITSQPISTYSGTVTYSMSKPAKVMIAVYDENNHLARTYVNNENQQPGKYTYNYQMSGDLGNKKYYLRLFKDGKLEEELPINEN